MMPTETLRYALWLYRLWKRRHGRIRAAWMAFNEARNMGLKAQNSALRAALANIGDSLLPAGVNAIRFMTDDGKLISESGYARTDAGALRMPLNPSEQVATLVWKNGFFLLSENMMIIDERFVGKVRMAP